MNTALPQKSILVLSFDNFVGNFRHGLRYTVDASRPSGKRIIKAEIMEPGGKAVPLDLKKKYRVALFDYLTGGGDGYAMLKDGIPVSSPPMLISDIVGNYISQHSPLRMPLTRRIRRVK